MSTKLETAKSSDEFIMRSRIIDFKHRIFLTIHPMTKRLKKSIFFYLLLLLSVINLKAQKQSLSGYIVDIKSGEKLAGVVVYNPETLSGVTSNEFGYYKIELPKSLSTTIEVRLVGFTNIQKLFNLQKDSVVNFLMKPGIDIEEVQVTANLPNRIENETQMNISKISATELMKLPIFFGERNILKAYQTMPGIVSGTETSSALYVRGGSPDQNLVLLDDAPLYYINHYGGFFSIFNDDAINQSSIITGGFPAKYGGRLSSVLDIRMKDGNMKTFEGNASVGIIASKVLLEGPIIKDRISFMVSARSTLIDKITPIYGKISGKNTFGFGFYDINVKSRIVLNNANQLIVSYYKGDDNYFMRGNDPDEDFENSYKWGNHCTSLRWNKVFSPDLFSNLSLIYTQYRFGIDGKLSDEGYRQTVMYQSRISDVIAKGNFEYYLLNSLKLTLGTNYTLHNYNPGKFKISTSDEHLKTEQHQEFGNKKYKANEYNAFAELDYKFKKFIRLNAGLHTSLFNTNQLCYKSFEPRLSVNFRLKNNSALKVSYAKMKQYQHLLSYPGGGLPTDMWVSAIDNVLPQDAWISSVGFAKTIIPQDLEITLEAYYKEMSNLIEYAEGVSFFAGNEWEEKIVKNGFGKSYGAEFKLVKKSGNLTGWLAYTLSKTIRQFDELNFGKLYPFRYDRRHVFNIICNYELNPKITFSGSWNFYSGEMITIGNKKYPSFSYNSIDSFNDEPKIRIGDPMLTYNAKNNFRGEPTHRLDIGVNFYKKKEKYERIWNISVYNFYFRKNPSYYMYDTENGKTTLNKVSEYLFLPSVNYSIKF